MLRRGFGECLFVLVIGVVVLGQLLLNGLNPLNQQLHLRLWRLPRLRSRNGRKVFQLVGVGAGQVQRQLGAGGADQFVKHAGRQNDGLQCVAHLAAQRPGAGGRQTDGHTRLGNQGKPQKIANLFVLLRHKAAQERTGILAHDTHQKIEDTDHHQRRCADALGVVNQRIQIKVQPGTHEEQQQNGGAEIVELLEQPLVVGEVYVDHAHGHAPQQRGNVQHGADAAEGEQQGDGDDEPVIRGALVEQQLQEEAEASAQQEHQRVDGQRLEDSAGMERAGGRSQRYGNGDAVGHQSNHIVQRHHLQQGVHKVALGVGLADGHNGGGRCGSRSQGGKDDGEIQFQSQHEEGDDKHQHRGEDRLKHRDDHDLPAAFFQRVEFEEFAGAEGDKGQRDIGDEIHAADHVSRHQIQAVGADEDARHDVRRDIGQPHPLGDTGSREAADQHERDGNDNHGDGIRNVQLFVKWSQQGTTLLSI